MGILFITGIAFLITILSPVFKSELEAKLSLNPSDSLLISPTFETSKTPENLIIKAPEPITPSNPKQLRIDPDKLLSYLVSLEGERYQEAERQVAQNFLIQTLEGFGLSPQLQTFDTGVNLVAERPGTDPNAGTILIAAHYDTVLNSPGADDNGSGLAVALEVARLFSSQATPRTLKLVFFDQEEAGLLGSLAFTSHEENLKNLRGAIILDMVGYACHTPGCQTYPSGLAVDLLLKSAGISSPDKGEFLAIVGESQHPTLLQAFRESIQDSDEAGNPIQLPPVLTVPVPLKGLLTPDVLRSDHAAFWYQNIEAVLVTDTANLRSPHYHQPTDSIANLDQPFLMGAAQIIVNATAQLLQNTEPLETKRHNFAS